jgi:DNA-binding LytR/AlgR family response regulator
MIFFQGEKEYYFSLDEILFFETEEGRINAHTKNDVFQVKYRLYELEEMLPSTFVRVAKSTIVNIRYIRSITKSLASASELEFVGSHKVVYVSRNYYKALKHKLEERR